MRDGHLCMSTITAPHTMLAVKALQSTADVLPLATPHIYTVPQTRCAALSNGWVHTKVRRIQPLAYKNAAPPTPRPSVVWMFLVATCPWTSRVQDQSNRHPTPVFSFPMQSQSAGL